MTESNAVAQTQTGATHTLLALSASELPLATPLEWPIADANGTRLLDIGATVSDEATRAFLFDHFKPHRLVPVPESEVAASTEQRSDTAPLTLDDISLKIGERIGVRGASSAMYASRVIGFSSVRANGAHALFITQPLMSGHEPLHLARGEQVDLVVIASVGVFRFACTVDAVCREPFQYVVLSEPGIIRRLRARKFARLPTRLAARYQVVVDDLDGPEQIGRISDISPFGMSLTVAAPDSQVGDRLRLSFHFTTDDTDVLIETLATVRHVDAPDARHPHASYGLEFDMLEPSQRIALKSFMAENA
jgi:c-di-GMP-binding flagellar brake protein YcgR